MFARFFRWLFGTGKTEAKAPPPAVPAERRDSFFSTEIDLDDSLTRDERLVRLEARAFPRTVGDTYVLTGDGANVTTFAQDSSNYADSVKATFSLGQVGIPEAQAMWYGSQGFIGYQMCALMAQHWLINKACAIPARDAIRKGYDFTVNDGSTVAPEVLDAIRKANKRYRLNRTLVEYVKMGRVFGIRVALFKVESTDPDYYVKPFNPDAITPGSYRGISQIDPYWCVPELTSATASDPSALDFYEPTYWLINNKRYHKSHLVVMRGPEVADVLKPSYLYGGLSVPQLIFERVYAAERTANEAPQLALTKRAMIFYTDVAKALANQAQFEQRLTTWAQFRDNYGVKIADKEADTIEQKDTSLSDLDAVIMTQYQIVAAAANIPATKLLGTTPKGFNATGEYEAESYHEELESIQVNDMEPLVDRHLVCLIRSEIAPRFGIQPFAVECTWKPIDSMSSKESAEVRKLNAEADKIYAVDIGAVDGQEVRAKISADEQSGFNGLPTLTNEDDLGDAEDDQANGQA
jgi:phage-related protein (TIGR01555 family)